MRTEYNTGRTVKYKIYTHSNKELILLNLQHKLINQITMPYMMWTETQSQLINCINLLYVYFKPLYVCILYQFWYSFFYLANIIHYKISYSVLVKIWAKTPNPHLERENCNEWLLYVEN